MTRFSLSAVLVCAACQPEQPFDLAAWLQRAELHVDTSQPGALAQPDVLLDLSGGEQGHYVRLDGIWAQPVPGEASLELELDLEDTVLFVPAYASLSVPLVNKGITNGSLAAHCQSSMPMTLYLGSPGDSEINAVAFEDLIVFCP